MSEIVDVAEFEKEFDADSVTERYREFREQEGIPAHTGLFVEDISEVETDYWKRTGQKGAFVNLYGCEGSVDLQIHELEPNGETTQQHHLYEEIVYVVEGNGATAIGDEEDETIFEWGEGALFFIPPNTPYRHVNLGGEPARLMSQTTLPQLITMVHDDETIFNPKTNFWDKIQEDEYYSADGAMYEGENFPVVWEANFIPNIQTFDNLEVWHNRGAGGMSVRFPFSQTSMFGHISEFPVGTYKKAHRHGPGANVGILAGEGYSLLWREGWDEKVKIEWGERSVYPPPARWYHQHFNTGSNPARYFAIHAPTLGTLKQNGMFNPHIPANQIEYVNEDPAVRNLYESELEKRGLKSHMPSECYTDPDFEF